MMSLSAIDRESREYAPMVRASGSLPNPGSALHEAPSRRCTWERTVPGPAEATRRQVRLTPSSRAAMPGFACAVRTPAQAFFYSVQVAGTSGPLSSSARSKRKFGAVGHVREAKS
jgi:hypothetical protein